jgi:alkylation response protein AidB-like acyl-CoA dehydrogenase
VSAAGWAEAGTEEVRAEVRRFLEKAWDPDRPLREWRELLVDSGWGCPAWPTEWYGRALGPEQAAAVGEELRRAGAVGPAVGVGMALAAPTILEHGGDEVKRRFLRPIATGAEKWCQLFSEPGAGSDLAGLTTGAERHGDDWVVNGQKVWTSGAQHADYGLLLARTDWEAEKHRGISFFALPMRQPGVEVRPLAQMNGRASFNEVFLSGARVPHANLVGELHGGWAVALTTLAHERGLQHALVASLPRGEGRTVAEAREEAAEYLKTYEWYPQRAGRPDLAVGLCREMGKAGDPVARQLVAGLYALERVARWTAQRAQAARAAGRPPGPEGSLAKLLASEVARRSAAVHGALAGTHALLVGPGSPAGGLVAEVLLSTPAASIAGGTDEVQRNIVGERVLGLPKEPAPDAGLPFRELRTNLDPARPGPRPDPGR